MKKLTILLSILIIQLVNAQDRDEKTVSIFNRVLIMNSNNEILVVKIKDTDLWVTPGLYQNNEQTVKEGLNSLVRTYGIKTESPKLNGVFVLKREINSKKSTSLRNVYTIKLIGGNLIQPKGIEEMKWLSAKNAIKQITFPHINVMIEQIANNPNQVWGGTLMQFKEKDEWKTKMLEDFYVLSN